MYDGLYEAALGAAPTILIAYVLEARFIVPSKSPRSFGKTVFMILSALTVIGCLLSFSLSLAELAQAPAVRSGTSRWVIVGMLTVAMGSLVGTLALQLLIGMMPNILGKDSDQKEETDESLD